MWLLAPMIQAKQSKQCHFFLLSVIRFTFPVADLQVIEPAAGTMESTRIPLVNSWSKHTILNYMLELRRSLVLLEV